MRTRALTFGLALVFGVAGFANADCPNLVGRWPYLPVQTVTEAGTTAYLGSGSTLAVLDISNPASAAALGSLALPAVITAIAVSGGFAYVADGAAGLRVVDVRDPAHPVEVGHADASANDVAVVGTRVYLAADALVIYDATNPASLVQLGSWSGRGRIRLLAVSGDYAYVEWDYSPGYAWAGVRIADPANLTEMWRQDEYGLDVPYPTDVEAVGTLLLRTYADSPLSSLSLVDVSDPAKPVGLGGYPSASASAVSASGGLAFLADQPFSGPATLSTINIGNPRNPTPVGSTPLTTGASDVAVSGHTALVADREAGLYLFDTSACGVSGCSVSATPVVPTTAVAGTPVAFQGAFLQSGCTGTPAFDWDFGDGSAHSSVQSPSHTYPYGGTFRWSLTVTLGGASASTSATIAIASTLPPITSPGAFAYVVPTSAHKNGYNGTHWLTDLVLTNPGLADSVARLYFMKGWQDNTGSPARPAIVPLRRSLQLSDVVASTFQQTATSGAIVVGSDVPLIVTSRTYNDAVSGTFGQFVKGAPLAEAFGPGATAWLTGLKQSLSDTVGFRTNIGLVNAAAQHVRVEIALYGSDGIWLGNRTVDLNPFDFQQVDKIFAGLSPTGVDGGYALLTTSTPDAVLFAYASVIDNSTGDPIAVPGAIIPATP